MRKLLLLVLSILIGLNNFAFPRPQPQRRVLDAYVIDVEGGEATLFVSPSGESLLMDTGWSGFNGRDAERILAVARQAGLHQIDYLLITHFHVDHIGGTPQLASRLPIRHFVDHGTTVDRDERGQTLFRDYAALRQKGSYIVVLRDCHSNLYEADLPSSETAQKELAAARFPRKKRDQRPSLAHG